MSHLILFIRDARWLTADRARAWCWCLAVMSLAAVVIWIGLSHGGQDRLGKPLGTDFIGFWAAGHLAATGHVALAYDPAMHMSAELAVFPSAQSMVLPYLYPPTFLLLCLPLALLPYLIALTLWMGAGLVLFVSCVRRLLPQRWAILPILAFPGVLVTAGHGQSAFLTASCFGGGMAFLQRRPFIAGLCLGSLAIKPNLAVAVPLALFAARRWKAVAGAAVALLGLCGLSTLVLGAEVWGAFLRQTGVVRNILEEDLLDPAKMQSVFAAVRLLGGGNALADTVQLLAALAACILLIVIVWRRPGAHAEIALLVAATMFCTPYLLDYDLTCLALPLAWVMAEALRTAWRGWEKSVLLAAYLLPSISRPLAMSVHVPIGPVVMAALLAVVARRAASPQLQQTGSSRVRQAASQHLPA